MDNPHISRSPAASVRNDGGLNGTTQLHDKGARDRGCQDNRSKGFGAVDSDAEATGT